MSFAPGSDDPGVLTSARRPWVDRARRRARLLALTLTASGLALDCYPERQTAPEPSPELAELTLVASAQSAAIDQLVVRVSAADISPTLVFNLPVEGGVATGTLKIPAGSARTITATALAVDGTETHRGERTLDVRPGPNSGPLVITMLPIAGSQPIDVWLGSATITITQLPASLRVDETATLAATVTVNGPSGPVPIVGAEVLWATATPSTIAVGTDGAVTGLFPGSARVAATYAGVGAIAEISVVPKAGYYAAPTGTIDGDGSWDRPWDLTMALTGGRGRVGPGDVIWLRGGVYAGEFRSSLIGLPAQPIIVRQYRRERATIEGNLRVEGAYATYWGFEIRQADPMSGRLPTLQAYAPGGKYVNLIIHDASENGISFRTPDGVSEIYGCIIFNNGNLQALDHGIYAASEDAVEAKWIRDNVVFNNIASGIQVFGDETHPVMRNVHVVGNISFNNSSIAIEDPLAGKRRGGEENINVGGRGNIVENFTIRDNFLYFSPDVSVGTNLAAGVERDPTHPPQRNVSVAVTDNFVVGGRTMLRVHDWEQATVATNTFVAPSADRMVRLTADIPAGLSGIIWTSNTQYRDPAASAWRFAGAFHSWPEFMALTGLGSSDNVTAAPFTATKIFVRPNAYEPGRAHIAIYSPTGEASIGVDVTGILQPGDRFEVRNVQDIFGQPVVSGIYQGGSIPLPMAGITPPPAAGRGPAPVTGPYFNAFLLTLADR